jgi:ribonuclease BN (tRNA processing enzyme)
LAVRDAGTLIMVDAGPGSLRQLARAGLDYKDLDGIFFTHFHPDHVMELAPYMFAARYWPGVTRKTPTVVYGPVGLLEFYGHMRAAFGHWVEVPEDRVQLRELHRHRTGPVRCGGLEVVWGGISHTEHSLGYRFQNRQGPLVAVTGDTGYGPELTDLAHEADLLITECSFPDGQDIPGHLNPSQAGMAAREARVKALALTHFSPETDGVDLVEQVRREYKGPLTMAEDLARISIQPDRSND